jgi:hypothetical protein
MPDIHLVLEPAEDHWSDLLEKEVIYLGNEDPPIGLVSMPGGTTLGKTSVSMRLDLPDGRVVVVETTLAELARAVQAIQAKYGE